MVVLFCSLWLVPPNLQHYYYFVILQIVWLVVMKIQKQRTEHQDFRTLVNNLLDVDALSTRFIQFNSEVTE